MSSLMNTFVAKKVTVSSLVRAQFAQVKSEKFTSVEIHRRGVVSSHFGRDLGWTHTLKTCNRSRAIHGSETLELSLGRFFIVTPQVKTQLCFLFFVTGRHVNVHPSERFGHSRVSAQVKSFVVKK